MKKKIYVIASVATLLMVCVVIVSGMNEAGFMNQIENNHIFSMDNTNDNPIKQGGSQYSFENVSELSGILICSDEFFYLNDIQLLFGPDDMIEKQASPFDYDGDKVIETIFGEMNGLVGFSVYVKGHIIGENQIMVFEINGLPVGRPPHPPSPNDHDKGFMGGNGLRL